MSTETCQIETLEVADGWSASVVVGRRTARADAAGDALPTAEEWLPVLRGLVTDHVSLPGYESLKYSRAGEVFRARPLLGDQPFDVVCKQSRGAGIKRRIARFLSRSRERKNFDRALTLLRAGISTARPLVLLERKRRPRLSWLVTEYVPHLVDLDRIALALLPQLDAHRPRRVKDAIIDAVVGMFVALREQGLAHRDLKASNILLQDWEGLAGRPAVFLVDLDGLHATRAGGRARAWRAVTRLAASLVGYGSITRTDHARFLRRYLTQLDRSQSPTGLDEDRWRTRFRSLSDGVDEYIRRARRRKAHKLDGYSGDP